MLPAARSRCSISLLDLAARSRCSVRAARNGADPLKGQHSIDADLLSAASTAGLDVHVITRNPNRQSIEAFIEARGVEATVHCVNGGGKAAKARVVRELVSAHLYSDGSPGADGAPGADGSPGESPSEESSTPVDVADADGGDAELDNPVVALFVDDDIAEHVAVGEAVAGLPVLRVLFVRS